MKIVSFVPYSTNTITRRVSDATFIIIIKNNRMFSPIPKAPVDFLFTNCISCHAESSRLAQAIPIINTPYTLGISLPFPFSLSTMSIISIASNSCTVIVPHSHLKSPWCLMSSSSAVFNNSRRRNGVIHRTVSNIFGPRNRSLLSISLSSTSANTKEKSTINRTVYTSQTKE